MADESEKTRGGAGLPEAGAHDAKGIVKGGAKSSAGKAVGYSDEDPAERTSGADGRADKSEPAS